MSEPREPDGKVRPIDLDALAAHSPEVRHTLELLTGGEQPRCSRADFLRAVQYGDKWLTDTTALIKTLIEKWPTPEQAVAPVAARTVVNGAPEALSLIVSLRTGETIDWDGLQLLLGIEGLGLLTAAELHPSWLQIMVQWQLYQRRRWFVALTHPQARQAAGWSGGEKFRLEPPPTPAEAQIVWAQLTEGLLPPECAPSLTDHHAVLNALKQHRQTDVETAYDWASGLLAAPEMRERFGEPPGGSDVDKTFAAILAERLRDAFYGGKSTAELLRRNPQARHLAKLPAQLAQPVHFEARRLGTAISEGRNLTNWRAMANTELPGLRHDRDGDPVHIRLLYNERLAAMGTDCSVQGLEQELRNLDADAAFVLQQILSLTMREERSRWTLDDLIALAGWGAEARRNRTRREELRRAIWRILLLGASCELIGIKPGHWPDPTTGQKGKRQISDMLFHVGKVEAPAQPSLYPGEPPEVVELIRSSYVSENFDIPLYFDTIGDLRKLAEAAPPNKASGHWARVIALNLNQIWREHSADSQTTNSGESVKIATAITRRRLLDGHYYKTQKPSVGDVLSGNNPQRALEYWDTAITFLRHLGTVKICHEIKERKLNTRQPCWKDEWLDQPLDIRPGQPSTVTKMGRIAAAKKRRQSRRTPRKKSH